LPIGKQSLEFLDGESRLLPICVAFVGQFYAVKNGARNVRITSETRPAGISLRMAGTCQELPLTCQHLVDRDDINRSNQLSANR
jgi:hypothetical protein